jgi:hydrogenase nickel incorporation protein HypA/HybF
MHEMSLMADLLRKVERIAEEHGRGRIVRLTVRLGALSHFSPSHFREHFDRASAGTMAEGATLDIHTSSDIGDPRAQDVLLETVELGEM